MKAVAIILYYLIFKSKIDLQGLSNLSNVILALFAILATFFAFRTVVYTKKLFEQQEKEEALKYRAFVSITNHELINQGEDEVKLKFEFTNNGNTAAHDIRVQHSVIIDGHQEIGSTPGHNGHPLAYYLNPNASAGSFVNVPRNIFQNLIQSENNKFVITIIYQDYQNNEYIYTHESIVRIEGGLYQIHIFNQYEQPYGRQ